MAVRQDGHSRKLGSPDRSPSQAGGSRAGDQSGKRTGPKNMGGLGGSNDQTNQPGVDRVDRGVTPRPRPGSAARPVNN